MTEDLNEEKSYLKRMMAWLEELARKQDMASPIAKFFQAFLGFFQDLLDGDKDPDFEDAETPEAAANARREFESGRRESERARYKDYTKPTAERVSPRVVTDAMASLNEMRAEAEARGITYKAIMPVDDARKTSNYGMRIHPRTGEHKHHDGADLAPPKPGQKVPIRAPMPGVVIDARYSDSYGLIVEMMDVNFNRHFFAHMDSAKVKVGQRVNQGDELGIMGNTGHSEGVHLHYELRDPSRRRLDPMAQFVSGEGQSQPALNSAVKKEEKPTVQPAVNVVDKSDGVSGSPQKSHESPAKPATFKAMVDIKLPENLAKLPGAKHVEHFAEDALNKGQDVVRGGQVALAKVTAMFGGVGFGKGKA